MNDVIEVTQLERTFGGKRAVDGMTFHVKQGSQCFRLSQVLRFDLSLIEEIGIHQGHQHR